MNFTRIESSPPPRYPSYNQHSSPIYTPPCPSARPLLRASCPLLHTVHPPPCPPAFPQHLLRPHLTPSTLLHPLLLLHPILRPPSGLRLLTHSTFLRPHLFHHPLLPPCPRPLKPRLQAELLLQIAPPPRPCV